MKKSNNLVRGGTFVKHSPENLAIQTIKDARKKYNLFGWPVELQMLTGIKTTIDLTEEITQKVLQPIKSERENCANKPLELKYVSIKNKKK